MEQIKEAFLKVKQDMDSLKEEILLLKEEIVENKKNIQEICEILEKISLKIEDSKNNKTQTTPTEEANNSSKETHIPTHNYVQGVPDTQKAGISTGNGGVPTDRQTDKPTDKHTEKGSYNTKKASSDGSINNAIQFLDSLDNLKKEIRLKFKRLTEQEFLVFSTIYQSSEEEGYTDYKNLSKTLNLTESSIRDYVGRLITKGIPVDKIKVNNKTIHLLISPNLKRITSLSTILQLRSL